jgi:hypothetical protein
VTVDEFASKIRKLTESTANLQKITDYFNKLSEISLFLVIFCKTNAKRIKVAELIIELIDELIKIYNYNSAFALYSGITKQPL